MIDLSTYPILGVVGKGQMSVVVRMMNLSAWLFEPRLALWLGAVVCILMPHLIRPNNPTD